MRRGEGLLVLLWIVMALPGHAAAPWHLGPFVKADAVNPILAPQPTTFPDPMTGQAVTWESDNVFNPAAVVRDGKVCLLYRAEDHSGEGVGHHTSRIGLAESADGLHFTRRPAPVLFPADDAAKQYEWTGGCEDPRCVETADGGYVLTYTAWDRQTARLSVATSRDLIHWEKHGPIFAQAAGGRFRDRWSKSGSIVTRLVGDHLVAAKIDGRYWMLWGEGTVSAATSTDLVNWDPVLDTSGSPIAVLSPRPGLFDSGLCESGPPAVLTAQGIVFLYNGKNADRDGDPAVKAGTYSGGQALLDAHDPTHVLARDDTEFITPERPYELTGQYTAGTVFIEGLAHFHHRWWLYYGTADSHVAVATAPDPPAVPTRAALAGRPSASLPAPVLLDTGWRLQDSAKVAATGEAVSRIGYQPSEWHKATVPGTVLTSLVNDGVYPEPLYGENNRPERIPDSLCRTSYWYRTTFTMPHAYAGRRVQLGFAGINYAAEVWVNGHDLGDIRGAFARGLFDVTPYVTPSGPNALAVQILPPPHPGTPIEQTLANGVGPNGGILASDGPTFLCTIGWDWIPGIRDRDMGIWQGVTLSATGPVTIADTDVTTDLPLPRTDTADLTIQTTLHNTTDKAQAGTLSGAFGPVTFRRTMTLAPGEAKTIVLTPATAPTLHISHPHLWWPNGYGPQNLYSLHLSFVTNGQTVSDSSDTTFGIRKITYAVPGSENLTLVVNGVPVVAKGGDWGMDEAMKRIPRARLDAEIRMHQQANYTLIRNWVGQSTSEDFYDLCDKYGILVWDEFFQPNPGDGPNPDDTDLYLANVREKVLCFRSHPCIALWCARNEGDPPPVIDHGLQTLLAELDTSRLYQRSSTAGRGVHSSGPYYWRAPRDFYDIDAPFKTEIGSVSIPTLESVQAMMPRKDWEAINDDWAEHDLARGAQGGDWYPRTLGSRYGHEADLADFVRKAQLANYEAFRAMYEGRLCRLFQPTTGVITWMSNPAQPSFVWQLYAHDLEPNASLFATRKACEPVHIMMNESSSHLTVINNTPQTLPDLTARVTVLDLDGSVHYSHTDTLAAGPSAATDLGAIPFPDGLSAVHFVKLTLTDAHGYPLSDNFYWRADPAHPNDLTALNTLPAVTLIANATRHDAGGKCLLDVTLHNPAKVVALMAHLQLRRSRSGLRVLPVFYGDNYVSLLPGETRSITIEAAESDLSGEPPLLAVDGWNVTVKPTTANGLRIVPNTNALAVGDTTRATPSPSILSHDLRINCGGGSSAPFTFGTAPVPADAFTEDADFVGGRVKIVGNAIETHVPNAAPESVYQSERWGACTYTIPVAAHGSFTVRLHFAETTFTQAGARKFNVDINGQRVLTDFDVYAEAGGAFKAVVKAFPGITPDAGGHIMIAFTNGSADQPKISGIEILPR